MPLTHLRYRAMAARAPRHVLSRLALLAPLIFAFVLALAISTGAHGAQIHESKKGLQVQMVDDALALGIRHAAINVNLVQLAAEQGDSHSDGMVVDGLNFDFNRPYAEALDKKIKPLLEHGVIVYLILLAYQTPNKVLAAECIHPNSSAACPFHIGAFNTSTPEGVGRLRASTTYLAKRYAGKDAAPVHFIVGNEVNSHWFWYSMGEAKMADVARDYERAVRICSQAAACISPHSRVYLSLDHHWNSSVTPESPLKSFGAHEFLLEFARLAREHGDYGWHLAFHPYPENLFESRTWNDKQATTNVNTPKITFKNIEFLNGFMKTAEMLHDGKPRRIILSEQGFHTPATPQGEMVQAAAYAYSYKKVEELDGIDAFILHRHVDNKHEGGLSLGLWTGDDANKPVRQKAIYNVFKQADTADWSEAFKFALPIIGVSSWAEIK